MRTRTTGRAGQQQARSPRAGGLWQSAWSSGAVRAVRSSENPGLGPAARKPHLHINQYRTAATRLSGDLAPVLARTFGPKHPARPQCDRSRNASADSIQPRQPGPPSPGYAIARHPVVSRVPGSSGPPVIWPGGADVKAGHVHIMSIARASSRPYGRKSLGHASARSQLPTLVSSLR